MTCVQVRVVEIELVASGKMAAHVRIMVHSVLEGAVLLTKSPGSWGVKLPTHDSGIRT